jgi:hypothetical protein
MIMDDTYVYISVKLYLKDGVTLKQCADRGEDYIQKVIQEMEYSFKHDDIIEHEIVDILDVQMPVKPVKPRIETKIVDPFDLSLLKE